MLPVLVPSLGENWSLLLCPLFFGVGQFPALFILATVSVVAVKPGLYPGFF